MGTSIVRHDTGEEIITGAPFDFATYLSDLASPAHLARQQKLAAVYDAACLSLIGPNDVQVEGGRSFKKKSAWRKLARHFTISTSVVDVQREMLGEHFLALVTVRASAPWGQSADAVGACCTDEATGRRTITVADAIATAETRATNRATSNLIAMGEVTAEEIGDRRASGGGAVKGDADKVMPFGKHKGKKLGDLTNADLENTVEWASSDGEKAEKFKDLIAACSAVIMSRSDAQ